MRPRTTRLFWRVFLLDAGLLSLGAVLLLVTPITISAPVAPTEALIVVAGLVLMIGLNAALLHRSFGPLERLVERMEIVDLLRPGQRLAVDQSDEIGRVVVAFNRMLDRLETERQDSGRRLLEAQEAERVGIARDLHDEVGQQLTSVLLELDAHDCSRSGDDAGSIVSAKAAVRHALDEVRRISYALRPQMLEQLGLASALRELSSNFERLSGASVERRFDTAMPTLTPSVELAVYRIAQEGLTNVARHADAKHVVVALERVGQRTVLRIADDGVGIGPADERSGGLRSMRERALMIGAALAIRQGADGGTELRLELPAIELTDEVD